MCLRLGQGDAADGADGDRPEVMRVERAVHGDSSQVLSSRFPVLGSRLEKFCVVAVADGEEPVGGIAGFGEAAGEFVGDSEHGVGVVTLG